MHKIFFRSSICPRMDAYTPEVKYFADVANVFSLKRSSVFSEKSLMNLYHKLEKIVNIMKITEDSHFS